VWEEWYQRASTAQQQELVALAQRQGVLYAFQLPPPDTTAAPPPRPLLPALLNERLDDLEPHRPAPVRVEDAELDDAQRAAVSMALTTPDIGLVQGYPGSGKSRVIAEILRQAARRGQRVLFVAPGAAALDRVLERLGADDALLAVRCLGPEESPQALPSCVRRLSLGERLRRFREETLPAARRSLAEAQAACQGQRARQGAWDRLQELAAQGERLAGRWRDIEGCQAGLAAAVDGELQTAPAATSPSPLQAAWLGHLRRHADVVMELDARSAVLCEQLDQARRQAQDIEAGLAPLRRLAEAVRGRRWWSPAWWRGVLRGNVLTRFEELERAGQETAAARAKLEQDVQDLEAQRGRADAELDEERRRLAEAEGAGRRLEIDAEAAAVDAERGPFEAAWAQAREPLGDGAPAERTAAATRAARQRWAEALAADERREAVARHWAEGVEQAAATLATQLARCAHVVAAPTAAVTGEPAALDRECGTTAFDLLVLEEADRVTESEFLSVARRARRWVLVGEPAALEEDAGSQPGWVPRRLRPGFFHHLWERLHADPRRLPYAWSRRGDRLVCTLRPVPAGQEGALEREPVADRPDVELHILVPPRPRGRPAAEPQVAEVHFPAATPIAEAKEFIYRELQELPVQTTGHSPRWEEGPARVVLRLQPDGGDAAEVALGEGVTERLTPGGWHTAALQFDRTAGWTRERAEAWVAERLGLRDVGRTVLLSTTHRPAPALGAFLSELLFAGACEVAARPGGDGPAVEFVAVPPGWPPRWQPGDKRRRAAAGAGLSVQAPRLHVVKGGAGLETDLADARVPAELPADVRAALPREGLVNYLEARAVITRLEVLLADADFLAAALRWQRAQQSLCACATADCTGQEPPAAGNLGCSRPGHCPAVAVIALYPAQVDLLRLLLGRSPAVAASPLGVEVGLPGTFRHRDCLAALVSLTRSHSHRAVPFGEGPPALAEALTRAAGRLILFGDPATLARRSQWQGPLDHLDERAAGAERRLIGQLVASLQQGQGPQAGTLLLVPSAGPAPPGAVEGAGT
jgi:hypothetical protein